MIVPVKVCLFTGIEDRERRNQPIKPFLCGEYEHIVRAVLVIAQIQLV